MFPSHGNFLLLETIASRICQHSHAPLSHPRRRWRRSVGPPMLVAEPQARAAGDAVAVLEGLGIDKARIVGPSMGGFCTVHFGLRTPQRAHSLTVAGAGYGC